MAKSNLVDPEVMRTFFEVDDRNQLLENFLQSSKFWSTYKRLAPLYINTIRDLNGDGCSWKNKTLGRTYLVGCQWNSSPLFQARFPTTLAVLRAKISSKVKYAPSFVETIKNRHLQNYRKSFLIYFFRPLVSFLNLKSATRESSTHPVFSVNFTGTKRTSWKFTVLEKHIFLHLV